MQLTVTKEFTWDCAHMLTGHQGLCKNLHGHTYKMQVEVQHIGSSDTYEDGPSAGMVVDFKDLKNAVNQRIVDKLDHAFIVNRNCGERTAEIAFTRLAEEFGLKIYYMDERPTAENMAKHFFAAIQHATKGMPFALVSVKVWETPTSYAEFRV